MNLKAILAGATVAFALAATAPAHAVTYTYVGDWAVDQGPYWDENDPTGAPVYTGQQAAALLFGGNASDYVISTNGTDPALINFSAWEDGWADDVTYGLSGNPAPENYSKGLDGFYNLDCSVNGNCYQSAYSAFVSDHGLDLTNYAFAVSGTPLPSTWTMLIAGFAGLGFLAYRGARKGSAAIAAV